MKYLVIIFIGLLNECSLKLLVEVKPELWNVSSIISASRVCAATVQPPVIHIVQANKFSQVLTKIIPHLGATVIQETMPLRGPILVVLKIADLKELQIFQWNPENCYVVIIHHDLVSPNVLLMNLWHEYKLYYVYVIKKGSKVVSFNPFKQTFTQSTVNGLEKFNNLHGSPMKLVMFERPPILIPLKGNRYTGVDGEMLQLLQLKMNFTLVTIRTSDNQRYGYRLDNGSYAGTLKDILQGSVDLAINGHFIKDYGTNNLTFSHYVMNDKLCALVPKAGLVPHLFAFMRCFSLEVWISVFISYIAIALIQYLIRYFLNKKKSSIVLPIIQNILNVASPKCPSFISEQLCQIIMLFSTFIIVNAFQGQIITFLNTSMYFPDIDTLQDIIDSNLEIFSSKSEVETLFVEDTSLRKLAKKLHTSTDQEVQCAAKTRDIVRFSRYSHIDQVSLAVKENLHLVSECLSSYYIAYVLPRGSPYLERINTLISRALEFGLIQYWSSQLEGPVLKKSTQREFNVLTINDLQISFIILAIGLTLSIIIFFTELIVFQNTITKRLMKINKDD